MTTNDSPRPRRQKALTPTVDDVFGTSKPFRMLKTSRAAGIFDDGEVDQFLADLYAMRRSDVA